MVLAHPLGSSPAQQQQQQQRYVPYTPRQQRHGVYGTAVSSYPPPPPPPSLPYPPYLLGLKSAAKDVGVGGGSVGWAMLERMVSSDASVDSPWMEIWNAITVGKATLLLPSEDIKPGVFITPELVKDHVVFIESRQDQNRQVVSLSGLRGVLSETDCTITFRSTLHPTSKLHHALVNPSSRFSAFTHLPPLPQHYHLSLPAGDPPVPYPSYAISTPSSSSSAGASRVPDTLPVPLPRSKPPLPPRPSSATNLAAASRLHNPFASLFGGGGMTTKPPALPPPQVLPPSLGPTTTTTPSSNSPLIHAISLPPEPERVSSPPLASSTLDVPVLVIDRTLVRNVLASEVNAAVHAEMAHALTSKTTTKVDITMDETETEEEEEFDIPEWVLERVHQFVGGRLGMYPFVVHQHKTGGADASLDLGRRLEVAIAGRGSVRGGGRSLTRQVAGTTTAATEVVEEQVGGAATEYAVTKMVVGTEEVAMAVQDFYAELEKEVRVRQEKVIERRREREGGEEALKEEGAREEAVEVDRIVKRVVEAVESVVCSLFYDRLFMQPDSDDASHDETLASRVAALNMLDLTLEHLDVDVGEAEEEIEWVVRACGQTLMQLQACYSPADKAAVLVGAHKVVVDGLSKLPPIRLIPEEESRANRARQQDQVQQRAPKPPFGAELKELPPPSGGKEAERREEPYDATMKVPEIVEPANDEDIAANHKTYKKPPPLPLSPHASSTTSPPPSKEGDTSDRKKSSSTKSTPVSGDVLLPILIFSVVKSNPLHLVSHLLFTQRYRNHVVVSGGGNTGEEGYCLVNLMAVAEFLENVDLEGLGLIKEGDRPLPSAAELTPIPIVRGPAVQKEGDKVPVDLPGILRGKVEQQVDAIAGSANKVLAGVMDTSFGMLKSFLPGQPAPPPPSTTTGQLTVPPVMANQAQEDTTPTGAAWNVIRPGFGLLKRENGFSIASIAASLPISRPSKSAEEDGQQMINVSRPASIRSSSRLGHVEGNDEGAYLEESTSPLGAEDAEGHNGEEAGEGVEEAESGEDEEEGLMYQPDSRSMKSIRSFESMMSDRSGKGRKNRRTSSSKLVDGHHKRASGHSTSAGGSFPRRSLTDRLAHMSALAGMKYSPPTSRRSSLMPGVGTVPPTASRPTTPQDSAMRVEPPIQRFLECSPEDLRISEVGDLLRDYQRLADAIRMMGGFSGET